METSNEAAQKKQDDELEAMSIEEHRARGARTAWRVIGGILVLATLLGFLAYYNYSQSSAVLSQDFADMAVKGKTLDTEACVPLVLEWHSSCQAIKTLCDHAIPMAMTHCLSAPEAPEERRVERKDYCDSFTWPSSKSKWTYMKCQEIGISKDKGASRDEAKACGNAFGAIENFCRHEGKGVRL